MLHYFGKPVQMESLGENRLDLVQDILDLGFRPIASHRLTTAEQASQKS